MFKRQGTLWSTRSARHPTHYPPVHPHPSSLTPTSRSPKDVTIFNHSPPGCIAGVYYAHPLGVLQGLLRSPPGCIAGVYYALFGQCCAFCAHGSGIGVYTATHPLGRKTGTWVVISWCEWMGLRLGAKEVADQG